MGGLQIEEFDWTVRRFRVQDGKTLCDCLLDFKVNREGLVHEVKIFGGNGGKSISNFELNAILAVLAKMGWRLSRVERIEKSFEEWEVEYAERHP